MEEYTKLTTELSGLMWKEFKSRIDADKTTDQFWTDLIPAISDIADKYKGTKAEGYAIDMAVFYLLQIQRIYRDDLSGGRYTDYRNALLEKIREMRKK